MTAERDITYALNKSIPMNQSEAIKALQRFHDSVLRGRACRFVDREAREAAQAAIYEISRTQPQPAREPGSGMTMEATTNTESGDFKMTDEMKQAIISHFLEWSGGFPPDSEEEIFIYVHHAMLTDADERETTWLLRDWMIEEWAKWEEEVKGHVRFGESLRCPALEGLFQRRSDFGSSEIADPPTIVPDFVARDQAKTVSATSDISSREVSPPSLLSQQAGPEGRAALPVHSVSQSPREAAHGVRPRAIGSR